MCFYYSLTFQYKIRPKILVGVASADYMHRECVFSFGIQKVTSKQCKKIYNFDTSFQLLFLSKLVIVIVVFSLDCSNVLNSNCAVESRTKAPLCGQIDNFTYDIVNAESVDWSDSNSNLTLNITFEPTPKIKKEVQYFVALFGDAIPYDVDAKVRK